MTTLTNATYYLFTNKPVELKHTSKDTDKAPIHTGNSNIRRIGGQEVEYPVAKIVRRFVHLSRRLKTN